MLRKLVAPAIAVSTVVGLVGSVMWFKWNADGPGTDGGGEDLDRKVAAPMADGVQPSEAASGQRRRERASISGTVRSGEGVALAGATVCAAASSTLLSASETNRPRCSTTGPDGRYRIADLFGVRQRISASAAGYLPGDHAQGLRRALDLRPGAEASDIDVVLQRGGVEVRGVVQDLKGRPIADAWISSGGAESGTGIGWARSGADGQYALWVRPGTVTVTAQASGHAAGSATGPSEGHSFAVYLAPASVLRGKVFRARDREPIEGARVRADLGGEAVFTDAAGHFSFDALAPGVYKPRVETDDGFGMAGEQVSLGLGETSWPLMIAVQPAVVVEGRIVHEDGAVCDDGSLTLRDSASGREIVDTTEPGGMVHVRALLPGTYTVRVACKGAISAEEYPSLVVRDRDQIAQVWQVVRGRTVSGVVVDSAGAPVAGARLLARAVGGVEEASAAVSDEDGRFVLTGLVAGEYQVTPTMHVQRTMPDAPVAVTIAGSDVVDLRVPLAATGEVRGTLRDPKGRAIAGAELTLQNATGVQRALVSDDGGFHFATAAVGSSTLVATLGGAPLKTSARPRISVEAGASATVELVSAAPTGAITGVLSDEKGEPLAGALIEAHANGGAPESGRPGLWRLGGERPQLTDEAGRFTLTGLGAATYTVSAMRLGGGSARRERVKQGEVLALALKPDGRITGTVALHGGGTPEAFTIELAEVHTGQRRSDEFVGTGGAWGFGGLSYGDYEVSVRAREGSHAQALAFTSGKERSGVRLELVGATTLRGRVLDLEGAPVPALAVGSSTVRGGGPDTRHITDARGYFELSRVPAGLVSITVGSPPGDAGVFGTVQIPVTVEPYQRVLELPPIRVARRRLAAGESRGDLGYTIVRGKKGADPLLAELKVESVQHGGPAAAGGLQALDEIVSVDGQDVRGVNRSLYATLSEVPAGTTLRLGLARGQVVEVLARKRR